MRHGIMSSFASSERPVPRHIIEINHSEVLDLVREQIATYQLNLVGLTVVTAAAAGYQAAMAVMASFAGANRVVALTRPSKGYPSTADTAAATLALGRAGGVGERIDLLGHLASARWAKTDIVAASVELGAISPSIIELLPAQAVIALMGEPWEFRPGFLDIDVCRAVGIKVVAPNLGHPAVGLLPDYATLCCKLLAEAGLDAHEARLAVVCDTPCAPFIEQALRERGAQVSVFAHPSHVTAQPWDGIILATRASEKPGMDINNLGRIVESAPNALLVQFSGGIDRSAAAYFGMRLWPPKKPGRGQLALPLEVLGPGPTLRRMVAGLKAAELAYRGVELDSETIGFMVASTGGDQRQI